MPSSLPLPVLPHRPGPDARPGTARDPGPADGWRTGRRAKRRRRPSDPAETRWLRCSLRDDHGAGDARVVGEGEVPAGDAEADRGVRDGASDREAGAAARFGDDLGVGPQQAARRSERLGQSFLGGEAGCERPRRQTAFAGGEQALGQAGSPGEGLFEAGDVDDVDTDADDHDSARRTASASCSATCSARSGCWASTMTRMTGSVPLGRSSTRPASPSLALAALTASATCGSAIARSLSPRTLISTCGYLVIILPAAETGAPELFTAASRCRPVSTPSPVVAWLIWMMCPDCSPPRM